MATPSRISVDAPSSTPDVVDEGANDAVFATSPPTDDVAGGESFDSFFTDSDLVAATGWGY